MQLDDDYAGYYGDYDGGYGGDFGDLDDGGYGEDYDDLAATAAAESSAAASIAAAAAASSAQGGDHGSAAPVPELKEEPEAAAGGGKAAEGNSRMVVDMSDEDGGGDAGTGDGVVADGSEVMEGEQEGLQQPEEEQKIVPFKVRTSSRMVVAHVRTCALFCFAQPSMLVPNVTVLLRSIQYSSTHTGVRFPEAAAQNVPRGQPIPKGRVEVQPPRDMSRVGLCTLLLWG